MRRLLATVVLGALLLAASATAASAPNPSRQGALDRTVRYLQDVQNPDGGFGGSAGAESGPMFSAWSALALAAAGVNPQDQKKPGGVDVYTYLSTHFAQAVSESDCAPLVCTTTLERELMVVNAAGTSPHDFGGVDLAGELLARADEEGAFPHVAAGKPGVNDTIFAIFALAPIAEPAAQEAVARAAAWVETVQHENGGWAWGVTSTRDEVDMTGAAIQALTAAGRGRGDVVEEGLAYLREAQNPDGGFPEFPGNPESNVASTAWAVQAIWAVGENPEDWRGESGVNPLDYLESMQEADGHIRWKTRVDMNGIWMTAYVTPAFSGHPWPIPAPPRALAPAATDAGVIAGGGGRGAAAFSRPKPQSRGRTPGGARVLRSRDPIDHSHTRRGANRVQPEGTAQWEALGSSGSMPAAVSAGSTEPETATEEERAAAGGKPPGSGNGAGGGDEVTGTLVSARGVSAFGAPGLRGGNAADGGPWVALGIGLAAALTALLGARLERRRLASVAVAGA